MSTVEMPKTMSKTIEIFSTKDYDKFFLIEGNRVVSQKHVEKLIQSMGEEECVSPIQVNEKMEIIDGQHRFQALMRMKKPVYYYIVKGAGLHTVQRLNSYTKNWTTDDYLQSFVDAGYKDYIQYKGFKDMYKFGNSINLLLLTGNIDRGEEESKFKSGGLKIKDIDKAVEYAMALEKMSKYISWYKERSFCYAIIKAYKTKGFDYDKFLSKCEYQQRKLVKCANTEQYLEMIEEIYNYHSPKGVKLQLRTIK